MICSPYGTAHPHLIHVELANRIIAVGSANPRTLRLGRASFGQNGGGQSDCAAVFLDRESILGLGFLLGGGYGIGVVQGTRRLLNANFSLRQAGVEQTTRIGLTLSGLF